MTFDEARLFALIDVLRRFDEAVVSNSSLSRAPCLRRHSNESRLNIRAVSRKFETFATFQHFKEGFESIREIQAWTYSAYGPIFRHAVTIADAPCTMTATCRSRIFSDGSRSGVAVLRGRLAPHTESAGAPPVLVYALPSFSADHRFFVFTNDRSGTHSKARAPLLLLVLEVSGTDKRRFRMNSAESRRLQRNSDGLRGGAFARECVPSHCRR
jgi:hypothetical protein